MSCFDDKRFILEPGLEILPHGNFWLKQKQPNDDRALSIPDDDDDDDEQTSLNNFDESEEGKILSDKNEKPSDKSSGAEESDDLGSISSILDSFGECHL